MSAGLFGLVNSNRDFSKSVSWGKNQFNSSFPTALLCYMQHNALPSVYLKYDANGAVIQEHIDTNDVFGMNWNAPDIFFGFEQEYMPFNDVLAGRSYPIDLVIKNQSTNKYVRALEIKLTAIPDNTTSGFEQQRYGAELVIRTPTIAYIASSICLFFKNKRHILRNIMDTHLDNIRDWVNSHEVLLSLPKMLDIAKGVCSEMEKYQTPLIVQPIWKTKGKSPILEDHCLDVFVWSDVSFLYLLLERIGPKETRAQEVSRPIRTMIWVVKMLYDFNRTGMVNAGEIMDRLSYGPKNDKALAINGNVTSKYLQNDFILQPRVSKIEIKNIIQGNGVKYLSPERRFDSSIVNDPDLYENH
ncbi:MAG: HindVP family restriction endonuclease [Saprospiraceae bacterium]|nr:HindVP family restriction endonuclease [Saprospiraceae bacterium]